MDNSTITARVAMLFITTTQMNLQEFARFATKTLVINGVRRGEERRECDTCDVNNPANHYEPSTGSCYKCDESIPTNHYFSDNHQCLSCNTNSGWKIFNPGPDQPKKCVYCPGSLRADGTCDYPPAKITYTKTVYDPTAAGGVCTGTFGSGMGWRVCEVDAHCEGGGFGYQYLSYKTILMYEGVASCVTGSTEPVYSSEGTTETTMECRNPEGEVTTAIISCP